jgi:hypothetical protein
MERQNREYQEYFRNRGRETADEGDREVYGVVKARGGFTGIEETGGRFTGAGLFTGVERFAGAGNTTGSI